ncbi:hypothetical protein J5N97_009885 [Dioscorea zingiberensis]|uniref:Uncharacterized protein n=1 Tax=Dioscorea zingiberensis TaxID=325984 RepID=A0A9D5HLX2_9LILI|nr:hypothetical protein J5N97_009885 [Dioscorea zingiberensis]
MGLTALVKTLLVKEELIQNLTLEKQALHLEVQNMQVILQRIQDIFLKMSVEDQKALSAAIENPEACEMIAMKENESSENIINETISETKDKGSGSTELSEHQERKLENLENVLSCEMQFINSCLDKPSVYSSPQSACSDNPLTTNAGAGASEGHIGCTSNKKHCRVKTMSFVLVETSLSQGST